MELTLKEKDEHLMGTAKDLNKTQMLQQIELENIKTQQIKLFEHKQQEQLKKYEKQIKMVLNLFSCRYQEDMQAQQDAHRKAMEALEVLWQQKVL